MDNRQTTIISLLNEVITLLEDEMDERKNQGRYLHLGFIEQSIRTVNHTKTNIEDFFNYNNGLIDREDVSL